MGSSWLRRSSFAGSLRKTSISSLSCSIIHALWTITFTDRRQLVQGLRFERVAPRTATIQGDLLDAARYLDIPRELFFSALKADGWTAAEIAVDSLRWLDLPYSSGIAGRSVLTRFL